MCDDQNVYDIDDVVDIVLTILIFNITHRLAVTHLAQSNGDYSKLLASVGLDKCVYIYDTTVCFGYFH